MNKNGQKSIISGNPSNEKYSSEKRLRYNKRPNTLKALKHFKRQKVETESGFRTPFAKYDPASNVEEKAIGLLIENETQKGRLPNEEKRENKMDEKRARAFRHWEYLRHVALQIGANARLELRHLGWGLGHLSEGDSGRSRWCGRSN